MTSVNANTTTIAENEEKSCEPYKMKIVWQNVALLSTLHIAAIYGFYLKMNREHSFICFDIICKFLALLSVYGITAGAHRLWAHRSYKANTKAQILLMFFASLTYQNSVYIWVRDHRLHHKYSETDADPHNSKRGLFFSHVGWLLVRKHPEVIKKGKTIDMSDLESNPIVMFQHKHYFKFIFLITVLFPLWIGVYIFNAPLGESFFIGVVYRYVASVNLVWCVNSITHKYGFKPYDKNIGPTENPIMKICSFGEGFHNYHHSFPWDYKASEFSSDTRNSTAMLIDFLAYIGWVTDRKTASDTLIAKKSENSGDYKNREMHMSTTSIKKPIYNVIYLMQIAFLTWIF